MLVFSMPTGLVHYQDLPDSVLRPVGDGINPFSLPMGQQSFTSSMIMPFPDNCHSSVELVAAYNQGIQQPNAADLGSELFLHNGIEGIDSQRNLPMNGIKVSEAGNDFKPASFPNKSSIVFRSKQYPLVSCLLSCSHMDHYFVKQRREIRPNHYLTKIVLHHQHQDG